MRKLLFFTILLLNNFNKVIACDYEPFGEDVRYSFFLPQYFDYNNFSAFYYNGYSYSEDHKRLDDYGSNVYDWYNFCRKDVSLESIHECLNRYNLADITSNSKNQFLKYLYSNNFKSVIEYLIVAKKCETINTSSLEYSWERDDEKISNDQISFLNTLQKKIISEKSQYLKRKYAFLTIRAAYYAGQGYLIHNLFQKYFNNNTKDYLYYWSLYFNSFSSKNDCDIANVFMNSPDKMAATSYYFNYNFNLEKALSFAKTKDDIAAIYAFATIRRLDPSLDYLKNIYKNGGDSKMLSFLLLRELNKIEDWVYTPYYTNFLPGVDYRDHKDGESTKVLRDRSEKDRRYAQKLLDFVNTVDLDKVEDKVLWKTTQIQLLFITRKYNECLVKINAFKKIYTKEKINEELEKLNAICTTANQSYGEAVIKEEIKPIILKYKNDAKFVFVLGRELEFKGNIVDGLALISRTDEENMFSWKGNRQLNSKNLKIFYNYFSYLDFVYSADQVRIIVNKLGNLNSKFDKNIYSKLLEDQNALRDLLGTKYLRENRLLESKNAFKSIEKDYWTENYNAFERAKFDERYIFDKNPFYDLKYTENFIPHKEKYFTTKLSVVEHLLKYINLAKKSNRRDKCYYNFLLGNCYYNMTSYGNSWMMRRFEASINDVSYGFYDSYEDEVEYRNSELAIKYYKLAFDNAKSEKFKALCLKFLSMLEQNKLYNINERKSNMSDEDYSKMIYSKNKYRQLFDERYKKYEEDLSSCENLEEYFKSR